MLGLMIGTEPGTWDRGNSKSVQIVTVEIQGGNRGKSELVLSDPGLGTALAWTHDNHLIYSLAESPPNHDESNLWRVRARSAHGAHHRRSGTYHKNVQLRW
jgi:hypothetical protein